MVITRLQTRVGTVGRGVFIFFQAHLLIQPKIRSHVKFITSYFFFSWTKNDLNFDDEVDTFCIMGCGWVLNRGALLSSITCTTIENTLDCLICPNDG